MSDNHISWKAVSLVVVLFALGIALGAVGEHLWNAHVIAGQRGPHPVQELKEELRLSPDQEKQFDAIISDERAKFHELDAERRAEWAPKYRALDAERDAEWDPKWDQVRQQGRDSIRAILTPDQRVKFEAFFKKFDEDRRRRQQTQQQQQQQR